MSGSEIAKKIISKQVFLVLVDFEGERVAIITPTTLIYSNKHYYKGKFVGYNLYASIGENNIVLETYDDPRRCEHVKKEIKEAFKKGKKVYELPSN